jgi:hypothetical protein
MAVVVNVVGKWSGKDIERARKELGKLGTDAEKSARKSAGGFKIAGQNLADMLKIGGIAGGALFLKSAIEKAGDLQDTVSATGQIFGAQQGAIIEFGKSAAQSMGLSETAALKAADSFAVVGRSAGLSGDETAGFSTTLTQLAGDMASFYGGNVDDAVTAIGSALRGEMEPIRKYNVLLDDATLRHKALEMGIISNIKTALTPQQKVLAANAAILAQTTIVQGDYNRTADQFSNVQRTMQAELENTTTALGTAFLPAATSALSGTRALLGGFNDIPTPIKVAAAAMIAGMAASRMLDKQLGSLTTGAKAVPAFFKDVGTAWNYAGQAARTQAGGVATLGSQVKAFSGIMRSGSSATGLMKSAGSGLMGMLGGPWGIAIGGATMAVTAYMNAQQNAKEAVDGLTGSLDKQTGAATAETYKQIATALQGDITGAKEWEKLNRAGLGLDRVTFAVATGGDALQSLRADIDAASNSTGEASFLAQALGSSVQNQLEVVGDASKEWRSNQAATKAAAQAEAAAKPAVDSTTRAIDLQKDGVKRLSAALRFWQGLIDAGAAKDAFTTSLRDITKAVHDNGREIEGNSAKAIGNRDAIRGALDSLSAYANGQRTAAGKAKVLGDGLETIRTRMRKLHIPEAEIKAMLAPYSRLATGAKKAGEEIATGIAVGIASKRAAALAQAYKLGRGAALAAKDGAQVASPSKITIKVGEEIVNGLTVGVLKKAGGAKRVIASAMADALSVANDVLTRFHDRGRTALDFINGIKGSINDSGSFAGFQGVDGKTATSADVLAQKREKVRAAQAFAGDVAKLRKLGLNNQGLQEIIGMGPTAGDEVAKALLSGGLAAITESNSLQSQLNAAASSIGDTAGVSQYGLTAAQATGLINTTVKIEKGAIVVHVGTGTKASDAAAIEKAVGKALDALVTKLTREIKAGKR